MILGHTIKDYKRENLLHDVITGIIIMAVSIPISMGYSQIAGLPAVYGLYGSVFPIILFALFSTSPQFIFGVDAAPAALVGSALLGMNIQKNLILFPMIKNKKMLMKMRLLYCNNMIRRKKDAKYTRISFI